MANRARGRRSDYQWGNFGDQELAQDITTGTGFRSATTLPMNVGTIVRVRGMVAVQADFAAIDENAMLLCGLRLGNIEVSAAAGATGSPELFTGQDDAADWIWQGALYVSSGSLVLGDDSGSWVDRIQIDSKAMRRTKVGQTLEMGFEIPAQLNVDAGGTLDITWYARVLFAS